NANGMKAAITNYGGIIVSLLAPDKDGRMDDVVLGFDTIAEYEEKSPHFGCITGRYANRIAKGRFTLDGKVYDKLAINNGPNALHGGLKGFDKKVWDAEAVGNSLKLRMVSPDGEEGYPGRLDVTVTYTLTDDNELRIDYEAVTDKPTVLNLTNHSYFNLAGHSGGTEAMVAHEMMINADAFTPVADANAIPTGQVMSVEGTPMDFKSGKRIGQDIDDSYEQIQFGSGYDHNWVLNKAADGELSLAARTSDPASGRVMETWTTEPGVQFYSANFLDGLTGKGGAVYPRRCSFCLETQHYPDSPNQPNFPSTTLRPDEKYMSTTIYKFSK
ncbi:MAG: galactose mutarotase, partial [Planctomycetes bacterium]|nr:galactose mutarotase [Planctomycetota bacterium]